MNNFSSNQELLNNAVKDHTLQRALNPKAKAMYECEVYFLKSGEDFKNIKLLENTGHTYMERLEIRAIYMDSMGFANYKEVTK